MRVSIPAAAAIAAAALLLGSSPLRAEPLKVCVTTPDLASITRSVGGDLVDVTAFCKGPEDPHFVAAKPSFVKRLSLADLFIQVGADLEVGYASLLIEGSRNARVRPGQDGFLDVSAAIPLQGIPTGPVDRSMGDVHVAGNPHYLLDPVNGLRAAEAIANRLAKLRPDQAEAVHARLKDFRKELGVLLLGPGGAKVNPIEAAEAVTRGEWAAFAAGHGLTGEVGGWFADLSRHRGSRLAGDHEMYLYLVNRFGLRMEVFLEPKPGIPPSTKHLKAVVDRMKTDGIRVLVASPYSDGKPVAFVEQNTGARVARLAHQTESVVGAESYAAMCAHNVSTLASCLDTAK